MISKINSQLVNECFYYAGLGGNMDIVHLIIANGGVYWEDGLYGAYVGQQAKVASFMISKGATNIPILYGWPRSREQVLEILYFGTPLLKFSGITGYQDLQTLVFKVRQSIVGASVMLPDLLNIVAKCIII